MGATNDLGDGDTSGVPAGRVLVLDERFVAGLDDAELQGYIDAVSAAASAAHADVDDLSTALSADLDRLNLSMSPVEVKMLAEQLFGAPAARLQIVTTGGKVLAERSGIAGTPPRPGSAGDPEHPDRPRIT